MNTELNTELNTPRTDAQAGWAIANQYGQSTGSELLGDPNGVFVHAVFARTLERELHESRNAERLARVQLGNERARLDYLSTRGFEHRHHRTGDHLAYEWTISSTNELKDVSLREVIDAAMKEDAK
jgi:hypothetical protein